MTKTASVLLCSLLLASAPIAVSSAYAQDSSGPIFLNKIKNFFGGSSATQSNSRQQVAPLSQNRKSTNKASNGASGKTLADYRDAQGRLPYQVAQDKIKSERQKAQIARANIKKYSDMQEARQAAAAAQQNSAAAGNAAVPTRATGGQAQPYVQQPRIIIPQNQDSGGPKPIFNNYR